MRDHCLDIRPIAGALGAEVYGFDMTKDLDDRVIVSIRNALLDHLVIFFRDQHIDPTHQIAFAKRFGELVEYPLLKGLDEYPEIVPVIKNPWESVNFGGLWHSDTCLLYTSPSPRDS